MNWFCPLNVRVFRPSYPNIKTTYFHKRQLCNVMHLQRKGAQRSWSKDDGASGFNHIREDYIIKHIDRAGLDPNSSRCPSLRDLIDLVKFKSGNNLPFVGLRGALKEGLSQLDDKMSEYYVWSEKTGKKCPFLYISSHLLRVCYSPPPEILNWTLKYAERPMEIWRQISGCVRMESLHTCKSPRVRLYRFGLQSRIFKCISEKANPEKKPKIKQNF